LRKRRRERNMPADHSGFLKTLLGMNTSHVYMSQKVPARLHIEERIQLWNSAVHIEEFMTIFRKGRKEKKHPYPVLPFREVVGNPTFIPESPKPASWHGGS
jgi:hypothetical protein